MVFEGDLIKVEDDLKVDRNKGMMSRKHWTRPSEVKLDAELEAEGCELLDAIVIHTYIDFTFFCFSLFCSFFSFLFMYKEAFTKGS